MGREEEGSAVTMVAEYRGTDESQQSKSQHSRTQNVRPRLPEQRRARAAEPSLLSERPSVEPRPANNVSDFRMDDVDLAMDICGRYFFRNRILPLHREQSFSAHLAGGRVGAVTAGLLAFNCEVLADVGDLSSGYSLSLPMEGESQVKVGRSVVTGSPDAANIVGPVDQADFRGWASGTERWFILKFDRQTLEYELSQMIGRDDVRSISFQPLVDLRSDAGANLTQLIQPIARALDVGDGLPFNPLFAARLSSALMAGLLLVGEHDYRERLDSSLRPVRPAVIQRAVDFIETHAHEPLTMPMIAASAGISVRTLHRGFYSHLGTSPNKFLARVRMDGAHSDLMLATPELATVSEVASRWGFTHLGRFASEYRAIYGYPPSQTLREQGHGSVLL